MKTKKMKIKNKGFHSDSARSSVQILVKTKKKKEKGLHSGYSQIQSDFLPKFQIGGHGSILRTIMRYSNITGNPKGGFGTMPPS